MQRIVAVVAILATLAGCSSRQSPDPEEIAKQAALEAQLAPIGLANFAKIDRNSDGIIDEKELQAAIQSNVFDSDVQAVLQHMYRNHPRIGHVIRTEQTTETSLMMLPDGDGFLRPVPIVTYHTTQVWGISRKDLKELKDPK